MSLRATKSQDNLYEYVTDHQTHKLNDHKHMFIEPNGRQKVLEFINTPIAIGVR